MFVAESREDTQLHAAERDAKVTACGLPILVVKLNQAFEPSLPFVCPDCVSHAER